MSGRQKAALGRAIVAYMLRRFGCDVVVLDSLGQPGRVSVFHVDGEPLTGPESRAVRNFSRGFMLLGRFIR